MQKMSGFTIVEIVVICAVIAILATVIGVGWSGTVASGRDRAHATEQKEWIGRYETFRQRFSVYPSAADEANTTALAGRYCLGSGFAGNQCAGGSILTPATSTDNNKLLRDLAKVGTLPEYQHTAVNGYTGPWADYTNATRIRIYHSYIKSTCPDGTTKDTTITGANLCYIQLEKN